MEKSLSSRGDLYRIMDLRLDAVDRDTERAMERDKGREMERQREREREREREPSGEEFEIKMAVPGSFAAYTYTYILSSSPLAQALRFHDNNC